MSKEIRSSRTSIGGGGLQTTSPTVQSQVIPRVVPQTTSASDGLEALSVAFGQFFGQLSGAAGSLQEAAMLGERQKIEQENAAQKDQAAGDFSAGRPEDPAQQNDLDYHDTYRALLADRTGYDAVQDFQKWYLEEWAPANPQGDLVAARDEWAKQNLTGADDKAFEGQVMASFYKGSEGLISTHQENAVRLQIKQGIDNLGAVIAADAKSGSFNADRLAFYIKSARTLDPLNPYEAAPRVAGMVSTAIQLNPDKAISMLGVLHKPGTGINDKSFAESFPDAYAAIEQKAVSDHMQVNSMEALSAIKALDERVGKMDSMSDDEVTTLLSDMVVTENKYGGGSAIAALKDNVQKAIDKRVTQQVNIEHVGAMLQGGTPIDADVMRKFLPDFLKKAGIENILKGDPAVVGDILARTGGVVPEDYRAQISNALTSFNDPSAQMNALQLLNVVQMRKSKEFAANNFLTEDAKRFFDLVIDRQNMTSDGWEKAVQFVNQMRRTDKKDAPNFASIVGDTEENSKVKVDRRINDELDAQIGQKSWFGLFGNTLQLPTLERSKLRDEVLKTYSEYELQGILDWKKAVSDVVARAKTRIEVTPQNGRYTAVINTDAAPTYIGSDGKEHARIPLGFDVPNPNTGEPVNTVEVYENDLKKLETDARELLPEDGSIDTVSLNPHLAQSAGAYSVWHGGKPLVFIPGQTVEMPETLTPDRAIPERGTGVIIPKQPPTYKKVQLPDTIQGMMDLYKDRLPEGFGFIEFPLANGTMSYLLAYRPHFGDQTSQTLSEREKAFQPNTELPTWTPGDIPWGMIRDSQKK